MGAKFERLNPPRYRNTDQGLVVDTDPNAENQKPVLTRAEYDQARAILDALPPGYYAKCAYCRGWYTGGRYCHTPYGPKCEQCSG